ncbi:MAG TPA: hypothetical protein VN414_13265 [Methanosarcina sp.]|nr:hypothetical protein [Methanosarcina sp.]
MPHDEPFYKCPRYSKCSINNCPLFPGYTHENDVEKVCRLDEAELAKLQG